MAAKRRFAVSNKLVLFNTLAFAKFFIVVFVAYWLLVRRRNAVLLPFVAVAAYAIFGVGQQLWSAERASSLIVVSLSAAFTWALARRVAPDDNPGLRAAAASALVNAAAMGWLVREHSGRNLVAEVATAFDRRADVLQPAGETLGSLSVVAAVLLFAAGALALVRARKVRLLFLLGASYVFYAHWDWRFLGLIFGSSTIDYWLGLKIGRCDDRVLRKRWLIVTLIVNLGVLSVFKYLNFGVQSALDALRVLGFDPDPVHLKILLPVGISFFTFESMSYVIDVYRRHLPPHKSYIEYLSFVAFFPHLVAGPIVRPGDLLPQLGNRPRFSATEGSEGLFLIALGLLKKVAIGDYLAVNLVDRVFDGPTQFSALECYAASLGYAVQIYCDFSGYTDVAIGCALLLGIRLPLNFNAPYKAHNIQDFWRRWHISLSTWLRDYVYISLGGNRLGKLRTYANLLATMLLGGLWHGASWNFVIWGGSHGLLLALQRRFARTGSDPSRAGRMVGVLVTFHLVCALWVLFRTRDLDHARLFFSQLAQLTTFHPNLHPQVLAILGLGIVSHFVPERWFASARRAFIAAPSLVQGAALAAVALVLREMQSAASVPFVYFQF